MWPAFALAVALIAPAAPVAAPAKDRAYDLALMRVVERAFPDAADDSALPDAGREFLRQSLDSPAFVHEAIGPFDVYVLLADELSAAAAAKATLKRAVDGLTPLVPIMTLYFGRESGLISGRRFPIVLCAADATREVTAFDSLIALLDHCESGPGSWTASNGPLWNDGNRAALVVRTWDVQLVNLSHADASVQKEFYAHQLGYLTIAHLVHGLLRQGSWGLVPPWLDQGLIDELDIEAYGESWVGSDAWTAETEGWFRPGWSGFVPEGSRPPPPVTGPPADLATTIKETGDSWARRSRSATRHWSDLASDLDSKFPASLAFMAEHNSFLPRDRAYARCLMHLLLVVAPPDGPSLLEALDQPMRTERSGMYSAEPLTSLLSARLGGVPEVDRLAALPLGDKLKELGRTDIAQRIAALGADADEVLKLADHREQGEWLYTQLELDAAARAELFKLLLEAEHYEQMQAWKPLGVALDAAMRAALKASPSFPDSLARRQSVAKAFRAALPR